VVRYGGTSTIVHNTPTPDAFGGDPDAYQDGAHVTFENGDEFLEFLLAH
jgi:hypothetical protein